MNSIIGKHLITAGSILIFLGLVCIFANKLPFIGKLPGDILIKRENFTFYFPIITCILASMILSVLFYIFFRK